ncbi:uncharacterized protein BDR25DRAFT_277747 [Lindgomyces ingoldianus]|uniref:Uncharacterized protein n=1 Tax=Lindgomyces ingoldianus TaxID=673940 RepID=A0ACB6RCU2_9PLEO|nr:uncharacterized protein BDR25DRAFT_277747 [Lindgomyces ingoldianus]KAF2476545.1 hypothetical protein BDR25DRAFT_277747 [Lindgomyces ingoldianus]
MLPLRHLLRSRPYIYNRCVRTQCGRLPGARRSIWAASNANQEELWGEQARKIRSGAQQSMLDILEERGFVKDVAGGRKALDWLLTEKPIGAYVGVDPTAPSLHVGHLLPLMVLYWMYLHGFYTITLLGGGTVQIGDPSGRTSARTRQSKEAQDMNCINMRAQLKKLWINVKALGIKHKYSEKTSRRRDVMNNIVWLNSLGAVRLIQDVGSGMRLGSMLNRDSVRVRMESGDGMALSEFCYPLFQAYDWWKLYTRYGVQLQVGGSDQYGNICAGMDAVHHMQKLYQGESHAKTENHPLTATFGLTTPLLTTASGEKFGKSAGNAVWLDRQMMSSFDLYQCFLRTADDDVERYLKLFTFIPLDHIGYVMEHQRQDPSKRRAQHLLAKEIVELAHGARLAVEAEMAHKEAFTHGTNLFSLGVLRRSLQDFSSSKSREPQPTNPWEEESKQLRAYKRKFAASLVAQTPAAATPNSTTSDASKEIVVLPRTLLQLGSFAQVLRAVGLVSSNSEGHRLVQNQGAYVVRPNSGSIENPNGLKWEPVVPHANPSHYLIDFEALVLRAGKSKIKICHVVNDEVFEADGQSCPGWEEIKAKRAESESNSRKEPQQ